MSFRIQQILAAANIVGAGNPVQLTGLPTVRSYQASAVTGNASITGTVPGANTAGLSAPVANAPTTATTGGALAAATYYYKVTALNAAGETIGSNEVSKITTGTTSTVTVTWGAVAGATGYNVYRGTAAGAESLFFSVGNVTTFTDIGGGTFSATVALQVSADQVNWNTLNSFQIGGANPLSAIFQSTDAWPYARGNITAFAGSSSSVNLKLAT